MGRTSEYRRQKCDTNASVSHLCHSCVTVVSQLCHSCVTVVSQLCHSCATVLKNFDNFVFV